MPLHWEGKVKAIWIQFKKLAKFTPHPPPPKQKKKKSLQRLEFIFKFSIIDSNWKVYVHWLSYIPEARIWPNEELRSVGITLKGHTSESLS